MGLKVGVTGGIGSGKSIICRIISTMGYPVFYSDLRAKELMVNDPELMAELRELFGQDAYETGTPTPQLNRTFLAEKIFNDPDLINQMNAIVHPKVRKSFHEFAAQHPHTHVFNEAAILFETGAFRAFDKTILVTAPIELRIERVVQRDHIHRQQVEERMKNQWPDEKKLKLAEFVIQNDDQQLITPQVLEILSHLEE
jgi:dephospho-CoA kinase